MAITQEFLCQDEYYRTSPGDKIIVNDLNFFSIEDVEKVNQSMVTVYNNSETISTIPSCDCGELTGRYVVGKFCENCGTTCTEVHEKVYPLLWLRETAPGIKFLNPDFWLIMKVTMDKKIDCLRWLCDTSYNPPVDLPNYLIGLKELLGGVRSYTNTVNNLDKIIDYLLNHSKFKTPDKQENLQLLKDIYIQKKDSLFSSYIPIVNKKLFVMETTTKGKFINLAVSDVVDVVMTWIKANNDEKTTPAKQNKVTAVVISKLASLYETYFENYVVKKIGIFRKHVYGARSHFTFRAVITSVPGMHQHNAVHVPWGIGVTAFRPHILNKLVRKHGWKYKAANNLLFKTVKKYDPLIHSILKELISESPYMGIPVIAQRNPSLLQGSAQRVFITEFKEDVYDNTISISQLIIKAPNGDYDGDELNFTILLDNFMAEEFSTLDPFYNIPDTSEPYSISGNLTLLSPANSILSHYLSDTSENVANDSIVSKLKFIS